MRPLVLIHGWGLDATLWDGVAAALAAQGVAVDRFDRGYFGAAAWGDLPEGAVVVGHSLGAMLAARHWPDAPLVAINGFDRFCGGEGIAPRVLARMQARLAVDYDGVLRDFCARIGAPAPRSVVDAQALARDLAILADETPPLPHRAPVLSLQAQDDPLLPGGLRDGAFAGAVRAERADGGHLLPLGAPQWCADQIMDFAV